MPPASVVPVRIASTSLGEGTRAGLRLAGALALAASLTACGRKSEAPRLEPIEELEGAVTPSAINKALRRAGGGHYHAVVTMDIGPGGPEGQVPGARDAITTKTDVWMDKLGHFRLLETNDREGGREIIVHGKDMAVGLRYARLVRRPLSEPEATRYLEEAFGGPIAAWEIIRRFADVSRKDEKTQTGDVSTLELSKANEPQSVRADLELTSPLRQWRDSVNVESLSGQVRLEGATSIPTRFKFEARFGLTREGAPLTGLVRVEAELRQLGQTRAIEPPQAEELQTRQRTILEERALLGRAGGAEGKEK